ncbi:unnamed protein product, partial [Trichogramma brassicae]
MIFECKDQLFMRKDNYVVFVSSDGQPCDEGARQLQKYNMLPKFVDGNPGEVLVHKRGKNIKFGIIVRGEKEESTPTIMTNIESVANSANALQNPGMSTHTENISRRRSAGIHKDRYAKLHSESRHGSGQTATGIRRIMYCLKQALRQPDGSEAYWSTVEMGECGINKYSIIYDGYITKIEDLEEENVVYMLSTQDRNFALVRKFEENVCGIVIQHTEHTRLMIIESSGRHAPMRQTEIIAHNIDLFAYHKCKILKCANATTTAREAHYHSKERGSPPQQERGSPPQQRRVPPPQQEERLTTTARESPTTNARESPHHQNKRDFHHHYQRGYTQELAHPNDDDTPRARSFLE